MPPEHDRRLEVYLASLAVAPVPADLAESVCARIHERPGRRPSFRLPALAAAASLLVVVGLAMAAGWQPPFELSPGPPASPSPSSTPSPSPSPSPVPALPGGAWRFARVTTPGAELRTEPGGGEVIRTVDEDDIGRPVLVLGRAVVDGRAWTRVEWEDRDGLVAFAWLEEVVASSGPTGYQVPVVQPTTWIPCPGSGDLAPRQVRGLTQAERLACFGSASISMGPVMVEEDGRLIDEGVPAWLAGPVDRVITGVDEAGQRSVVAPLRVRPDVGLRVPAGEWIRLTGHFDDGAAMACTRTATRSGPPVGDTADQVLWCRQQLVVTGWTLDREPQASPGVQGGLPATSPPAAASHPG